MPIRVAAALLAVSMPGALSAAVLKLFPVRIELDRDQPVQTMTIENDSGEATRVQLRLVAWRQVDGKDVFDDTRDVLANPGLFEVPPHGVQIARFGLRTEPGETEKAYRVFLEEVPTDRPSLPGEVRTLLRISVPVFVPPAKPVARLAWHAAPGDAGTVAFLVRNEGNVHVQINRLTLRRAVGGAPVSQDMSVYLLPGTAKLVTLDAREPPHIGESFKVDAMTDQSDMSIDLVMEAPARDAGYP